MDSEREKLIAELAPEIEARIEHRIIRKIVDTLEEEFYPPEESFKKEFVKEVEAARKSKGITFKSKKEFHDFLDNLGRD